MTDYKEDDYLLLSGLQRIRLYVRSEGDLAIIYSDTNSLRFTASAIITKRLK